MAERVRRPRKVRAQTMSTWLKRRSVPTKALDTTVYFGKVAAQVTGIVNPRNMSAPMMLDHVERLNPGLIPAHIRSVNPDPGRCLITFRMDDLLKILGPYIESEYRP